MEQSVPAAILNDAPRPRLRVPRATQTPRIDGSPDDAAWQNAATIDELTLSLQEPKSNAQVPRTQIKLLWTPQQLFVRFVAFDDETYAPFGAQLNAQHFRGDTCEIFIDPVGDGGQWLELQLSPDNGVFSKLFLVTAPNDKTAPDGTYPPELNRNVWEFEGYSLEGLQTATGRFDGAQGRGWIADFALPAASLLKRLGVKEFAPMTMRANLLRYDWPLDVPGKRALVSTNWAPVKLGRPHRSPAAMGFLQLVEQR